MLPAQEQRERRKLYRRVRYRLPDDNKLYALCALLPCEFTLATRVELDDIPPEREDDDEDVDAEDEDGADAEDEDEEMEEEVEMGDAEDEEMQEDE